MLGAWAGRAERGTRQESVFGVCGEEGGLGADREVVRGPLSARSVCREGREEDKSGIRAWGLR